MRAKIPDEPEKPGDFAVAERRRRLIEKQRVGSLSDDPNDFYDLALGEREVLDERARVNVLDAHADKERLRRIDHAAAIDETHSPARLTQDQEVLRHRHPRQQSELLEDRPHAERMRAVRPAQFDGLANDADLAGVRTQTASQELDERALAGAVFADKSVNLASLRQE